MKKILASAIAAMALVAALAAPAAADPTRNAFQITLDCEGRVVNLWVFSSGDWAAGLDSASNSVFVPLGFDATFQLLDEFGNVLGEERSVGSKPGRQKGRIACSFDDTSEEDGMIFRLFGTVEGFLTPNR